MKLFGVNDDVEDGDVDDARADFETECNMDIVCDSEREREQIFLVNFMNDLHAVIREDLNFVAYLALRW